MGSQRTSSAARSASGRGVARRGENGQSAGWDRIIHTTLDPLRRKEALSLVPSSVEDPDRELMVDAVFAV